jgi:Na+/melibiose symporter-like transporter
MRRILARPDLRTYLAATTLSTLGDFALLLALGIWAKTLTGSNSAAALAVFFFFAPTPLAPLAGLLVDRVRRRPLLIVVNLSTAAVVSTLLLVRGPGQLWLLYLIASLYGLSGSVLASAKSALVRTLVPDDDELAEMNGTMRTLTEMTRLFAPLAGAGLFAVAGGGAVALLDAATFLVAAAALVTLRVDEPAPTPPTGRWTTELTAGLAHVRRTVALRQIVVGVGLALLVVGFSETVIFAVVDSALHRPATFVGVLDLMLGVGAVGGGIVSARAVRRLGPGHAIGAALVALAAGAALLAVPLTPVVLAGMAVIGTGVPVLVVGLWTGMQRVTPPHLQGRVFSAVDVLVSTPQTVSLALGAGLATLVDYRGLIAVTVVVLLLSAGYLVTRPAEHSIVDTAPSTVDELVPGAA